MHLWRKEILGGCSVVRIKAGDSDRKLLFFTRVRERKAVSGHIRKTLQSPQRKIQILKISCVCWLCSLVIVIG